MNICFYTSDEPSVGNRLNMNYLVQQRPQHNYSFLSVKSQPRPAKGFIDGLRASYAEMRFNDGRFDFMSQQPVHILIYSRYQFQCLIAI